MAEWTLSGTWGEARLSPPAHRWSLRARPEALPALEDAWGPLAHAPLSFAAGPGRAALRLSPDEWLLIADEPAPADQLAALTGPFALVDISDRQHGFDLEGPGVPDLLAAGCPLDLHRGFPPGTATRTVLAKAEVLLWRPAPRRWRLEVWRSFAPYACAFLTQAAADL